MVGEGGTDRDLEGEGGRGSEGLTDLGRQGILFDLSDHSEGQRQRQGQGYGYRARHTAARPPRDAWHLPSGASVYCLSGGGAPSPLTLSTPPHK